MANIDLTIFWTIYHLAGRAKWLDFLIIFVGEYLLYAILASIAILMIVKLRSRQIEQFYYYCLALTSALIARFVVVQIIRIFYHRIRPYLAFNIPHLLGDLSYSFPSGHATFLFALATGIMFVNKKLGWWLYAAAVVVSIGRIAGGVHYPSDILGGAVCGIIIAFIIVKLWNVWRHSKH